MLFFLGEQFFIKAEILTFLLEKNGLVLQISTTDDILAVSYNQYISALFVQLFKICKISFRF